MHRSLYGVVEAFNVKWPKDDERQDIRIDITLREYVPGNSELHASAIELSFAGAVDLTLNFTPMRCISLVNIYDVRNQLEDINYDVVEEEHSLFRFSCRTFESRKTDI